MILSGFQFIDIKREECESFQNYMERCYFIINNLRTGKFNLEELINKSLFFRSIKIFKCSYSKQIMEEISTLSKNAGIDF